ncbi:uncharacterized protein PAC_19737 [Phialocephala subalpina]|uniref:Uncharacterized protein n=1 Tax=Phialocephala subalpina TaxID=576137 RepID=A0A1L7XXT7_9HELO|nr:uncharacterized protein PAC_19737 [Phialocephala subalpina]
MSIHDPSLQASSLPRVTFFDLSRELRDYCYDLALTTPTPVIAWSGIRPENSESLKAKSDFEKDLETASQFKTATSDVRNMTPNLLRCNSIVAHEAASIFYGKNKFVFAGDWTWETVATWFGNIGPKNRTFVTSIELWQHQPSHAWQTASGERVKIIEFDWEPLEPPFPRNRHLYRSPNSMSEGLVESINPAIETFFELLGNERVSKLLLTISLSRKFIPGVEMNPDGEQSHNGWFSMDLPNIVEKLRTIYTAGGVDVIWKGELLREPFLEKRENIEARWEILDMEEFDYTHTPRNVKFKRRTWHLMRFTMRIRELPELLLAEEPSPYSDWGYYTRYV